MTKSIRKELVKKALVMYMENLKTIDIQTKSLSTLDVLAIIYERLLQQYENGEIEL